MEDSCYIRCKDSKNLSHILMFSLFFCYTGYFCTSFYNKNPVAHDVFMSDRILLFKIFDFILLEE